jgi:glyoxylase-like metal-dependent hydrolase (beta-lactamase superfamily II)
MELDAAIAKTGNDIKDVKAVFMGHLHLDHAGGLEHFRNTDVPIYVHELELKHAFYSVATKTDLGEPTQNL